jgi:hypothetical protein
MPSSQTGIGKQEMTDSIAPMVVLKNIAQNERYLSGIFAL